MSDKPDIDVSDVEVTIIPGPVLDTPPAPEPNQAGG